MNNQNPPAFPNNGDNSEHYRTFDGMSLRDYFAGKAMQGIMFKGARAGVKELVSDAYDIADAMLAERAKGG